MTATCFRTVLWSKKGHIPINYFHSNNFFCLFVSVKVFEDHKTVNIEVNLSTLGF